MSNDTSNEERAAFEAYWMRDVPDGYRELACVRNGDGKYAVERCERAWEGWQARATLAAPKAVEAASEASAGVSDDLFGLAHELWAMAQGPLPIEDAAHLIAKRLGEALAALPSSPVYDKSVVKRLATQWGWIPAESGEH